MMSDYTPDATERTDSVDGSGRINWRTRITLLRLIVQLRDSPRSEIGALELGHGASAHPPRS